MNAKQGGLIVLSVVQIVVILLVSMATVILALNMAGFLTVNGINDVLNAFAGGTLGDINILIVCNLLSIVGYALVIVSVFRPKMLMVMEIIIAVMFLISIADLYYAITYKSFILPVLTEFVVQIILLVILDLIRRDFKAGRALTLDDLQEAHAKRFRGSEAN